MKGFEFRLISWHNNGVLGLLIHGMERHDGLVGSIRVMALIDK